MSIIAMGLLQIIALNFSKELNSCSFRWLRTRTNVIVSEATVAYFFRKNIFRVIDKYRDLRLMRIIIANQNEPPSDDDSVRELSCRNLWTLKLYCNEMKQSLCLQPVCKTKK